MCSHRDCSVTWPFSTSGFQPAHVLNDICQDSVCPPCIRKSLPPTAAVAFGNRPWPAAARRCGAPTGPHTGGRRGGHPLWDPPSPWCLCDVRTSPVPSTAIFSMTYTFFLALTLCSLVWSCFFQLCSIVELAGCV